MNGSWKEQVVRTSNSTACLASNGGGLFAPLSDDIILNIFANLESDLRDWARLACVSTRFAFLFLNVCSRARCFRSLPSLASDFAKNERSGPPGGWSAILKISVCCPGLFSAGVLLRSSDFGLEREIGPDEDYPRRSPAPPLPLADASIAFANHSPSDCWSLFDDLYFDTIYDISEAHAPNTPPPIENSFSDIPITTSDEALERRIDYVGPVRAHLASGSWNLSREKGSKLLATRFKCDSLYLCDWPGCIHTEEKRNYMLFRGLFKDFNRSRVRRTLTASNRSKIELNCAFCSCKEIWDLHSAFCLRAVPGFHDDGEQVVRAYVCENGHVSGAWTDRPMCS